MSASHFLRHLAIAYNHFHPIDEHQQFAKRLLIYEKKRLKAEIITQLLSMEARCKIAAHHNNSEELSKLKSKIHALKSRIEGS
ncbi:hypothetical protein CMO88_02430 [Candidatus Woesearchaeota archaeon]|nr:hypothetical protein [Candidatus Woesearchaeota archaeon]|tara:strand:+ start:13063 stop:13311 length:249 start_codon:yes stop_codon:yes gene_type:complete